MDYIKSMLRKEGVSSLISSIIFAILGIILINNPIGAVKLVSYILGGLFAVIGIYKILVYLKERGNEDFYNHDMIYGIGSILLGIITVTYISELGLLLRILVGLWIVYSAMLRISLSLKLKKMSSNIWICSLVFSIIMLLCGLYTLFVPNAIVVTIGALILVYSLLDICEAIIFLMNVRKM